MAYLYPCRAPGAKTEKPAGEQKLEAQSAARRVCMDRHVEIVRGHLHIQERVEI